MEDQSNQEKLTSTVFTVKDLISYQDGAVVSRTTLKKSTGTVTVFAFDAGEGLSAHSAPFDAMVEIIDGEAEITISDVVYNLKEGEMIIMPAGEAHALKATSRFKMILTMIKS